MDLQDVDNVKHEKRDGYIVDENNKIVGEARNYDPYSMQGDIMMYDIDAFGFTNGYLKGNYRIMSEEDLRNEKSWSKEFSNLKHKQQKH